MSIADLRAALEYVKRNPNEYDPTAWFTGTTADLAGHLVMRSGWTPIEDDDDRLREFSPKVTKGDKARMVHFVACEIAGVSVWEGQQLWHGGTTLESLETMVRRLESDQAIFELLSLPADAYEHAWLNGSDRIVVACHRRTTYVRIGSMIEIKDHDDRRTALDYALNCAAGRPLFRNNTLTETM